MTLIGISKASEITGMSKVALASSARRWQNLPPRGAPIHCEKRNPDNPKSHWLFSKDDCLEVGGHKGRKSHVR